MTARRLTARFVESVKSEEPRIAIRDEDTEGLELRVTRAGAKTWALRYRRKSDGARRRMTLGRFPQMPLEEARIRAREENAKIARGADPAAGVAEQRTAHTFDELAADWIERHCKPNVGGRTLEDYESMLKRHVSPRIGGHRANEITKRDLARLFDAVKTQADARFEKRVDQRPARKNNDVQVLTEGRKLSHRPNRVFALVRSIYRWAMSVDLVKADPTLGMKPPIKKEKARERDLSPDEIATLWRNLDNAPLSTALRHALRLALVTAQRIGEVSGIAMAELDLNDTAPMWTVPSDRAKNGEPNRVPLSSLAVSIIRDARTAAGDSPWLFPSPTGSGPINPHAATKAMERARPALGIANFRVHDLRRTAASRMAEMGINPHTISLILNHVSARKGTVTFAHYVQYTFDREKRDALVAWGSRLEQIIVGDRNQNVVQLQVVQ